MRVAALYDVHGNLPALEAVLSEVDADLILVGGDIVPGPWPSETLERLRDLGKRVRFIRGNADREFSTESGSEPQGQTGGPSREIVEWTRARLSDEQRAFLGALPLTETVEIDGLGPVLFCHATPRSDDELLTRISPDERWRHALVKVSESVVVCGHTHVQFERRVDGIRLVNSGSVGMPYEAEPGAYWTLLGPEVEFRRTEYDAADIPATGWPEEWPAATPEEATEFFEKLSRERA
jgi:predicted phosphodiesterase